MSPSAWRLLIAEPASYHPRSMDSRACWSGSIEPVGTRRPSRIATPIAFPGAVLLACLPCVTSLLASDLNP